MLVHMVKSVLTSVVAYHAMVFDLPKWLIKKIDKFRRNFFWKGEEGKGNNDRICLVKWGMVCIPKELGGLKIMDLIPRIKKSSQQKIRLSPTAA
jgi:hypothetical protein